MTQRDRYARLAAQVEYPESWRPVAGETLVGDVVRWELAVELAQRDGSTKTCDLLVVRTPDGRERSVWMWHAALRYELIADKDVVGKTTAPSLPVEERKARPGDAVAINYRGKRPNQTGEGEWDGYRIAIDPAPTAEPDWAAIAEHESSEDAAVSPGAPYDPETAPFPEGF